MTSKTAIYRKSAKGTEAIATRKDPALTPRLRSVLIMVDGKRNYEALENVAKALGDTGALVDQLIEAGMIEPASDTVPSGAPPVAPDQPVVAAERPTIPLAEARRAAARRLTDLLGPTAEDLCLRIEGARNVGDFQAALAKAEVILRDFRGAETAAAFAREMQARRAV